MPCASFSVLRSCPFSPPHGIMSSNPLGEIVIIVLGLCILACELHRLGFNPFAATQRQDTHGDPPPRPRANTSRSSAAPPHVAAPDSQEHEAAESGPTTAVYPPLNAPNPGSAGQQEEEPLPSATSVALFLYPQLRQDGFSNQLMDLLTYMLIAHHTNRTLVLPVFYEACPGCFCTPVSLHTRAQCAFAGHTGHVCMPGTAALQRRLRAGKSASACCITNLGTQQHTALSELLQLQHVGTGRDRLTQPSASGLNTTNSLCP